MRKYFLIILLLGSTLSGERIKKIKLSNGISCILIQKEVPTFSFGVLFKGGVGKINSGQDGIEYLLLKSMVKGTEKIPYPYFLDTLEYYGIDVNITPSLDYSLFTFKSIDKFMEKTIQIVNLIINQPEFNKKAFERTKKEIINELKKQKEDPDEEIWEIVEREFYENHPYSIKPRGKIESISKLTLQSIEEYYKEHFKSGEIIIGCAGNFDFDKIKELIERYFSGIKKGDYKEKKLPPFSEKGKKLVKDKREDLETSYFACKFPAPSPFEKDYPSFYLLMRILSYRLWSKLRTEKGFTYSTYAGASKRKVNYGYMYFSSVYPDSAFEVLNREIEKIKREEVSLEQIKKTINSAKTSFYNRIASVDRLIETILVDEYITDDVYHSFKIFKRMETITPEKILKIAQKYLKKERFFFAFLIKNTLK